MGVLFKSRIDMDSQDIDRARLAASGRGGEAPECLDQSRPNFSMHVGQRLNRCRQRGSNRTEVAPPDIILSGAQRATAENIAAAHRALIVIRALLPNTDLDQGVSMCRLAACLPSGWPRFGIVGIWSSGTPPGDSIIGFCGCTELVGVFAVEAALAFPDHDLA